MVDHRGVEKRGLALRTTLYFRDFLTLYKSIGRKRIAQGLRVSLLILIREGINARSARHALRLRAGTPGMPASFPRGAPRLSRTRAPVAATRRSGAVRSSCYAVLSEQRAARWSRPRRVPSSAACPPARSCRRRASWSPPRAREAPRAAPPTSPLGPAGWSRAPGPSAAGAGGCPARADRCADRPPVHESSRCAAVRLLRSRAERPSCGGARLLRCRAERPSSCGAGRLSSCVVERLGCALIPESELRPDAARRLLMAFASSFFGLRG